MAKGPETVKESWMRSVMFRFGGESGITAPEGLTDLKVGEETALLISGKVTGIGADEDGQSLTLEVREVGLAEEPKRRTIGEMLRNLKGKE